MYHRDTFDFELCAYEMYWWDKRMLDKNSNILETDGRFSARIHVWYILTPFGLIFLSQMKAKKKNYTWNSLLHHLALKGIGTNLDSPVQKPPAKSSIQPSSPVVEDSEKLNGRRALLVLGVPSLRTQRQRQPLPPLASGGLREPLNKALLLWGGRECLGGTLRFP